jgi:putative Mg2+ transporter-C (MgtC) family protein
MSQMQLSDSVYFDIALRLVTSLVIGGLIGLERSYHGRPAGFRTHSLVCLSTSLLMLVTVYETHWFPSLSEGRISLDPTRMAQGIMTGIGFLGAGAILKAGFSIQGLTTAASIWITAALGILAGIGFFFPVAAGTAITLGVLTFFRWIEARTPTMNYAECVVKFVIGEAPPEAKIRALVASMGFGVVNVHHRMSHGEAVYEYRMIIRTSRPANVARLSETLRTMPSVKEFRLAPTTD